MGYPQVLDSGNKHPQQNAHPGCTVSLNDTILRFRPACGGLTYVLSETETAIPATLDDPDSANFTGYNSCSRLHFANLPVGSLRWDHRHRPALCHCHRRSATKLTTPRMDPKLVEQRPILGSYDEGNTGYLSNCSMTASPEVPSFSAPFIEPS